MKGWLSILLAAGLLTACSAADESKPVEETTEEVETKELTAEEKMIQDLPEKAEASEWSLLLVNPDQALPADFSVALETVDNEQRIDERIVKAWTDWRDAASQAGHSLFLASAYRDIDRQKNNFNQRIADYMAEGLTENKAREKAKEYLTEPGHSEHHTGLALDIVDEEWIVAGNGLDPAYEEEESQKWLTQTMTDYGFILRYPKGKEAITQIEYEPWHFRYVGVDHAKFMEAHDLTLEEYHDLLKQAEQSD